MQQKGHWLPHNFASSQREIERIPISKPKSWCRLPKSAGGINGCDERLRESFTDPRPGLQIDESNEQTNRIGAIKP